MRKKALFLLALSALLFSANPTTFAGESKGDPKVKKAMKKNFQLMNDLFVNILLTNDYAKIKAAAQDLQKHAQELLKLPVKSQNKLKGIDKSKYMIHVNQMNGNLTYLVFTAQQIIDAEKSLREQHLRYLRPQAAEHFGQVLKTCVVCHHKLKAKEMEFLFP